MKGSDGKEDLFNYIFSGWIFLDANFTHALPLCEIVLNACCLSEDVKCQFISFLNAFYFKYFGAYVTTSNVGDFDDKNQEKKKHYKKPKKQKVVMLSHQSIL